MAVTSVDALVAAATAFDQAHKAGAEQTVALSKEKAGIAADSAAILQKVSQNFAVVEAQTQAAKLQTQGQVKSLAVAADIDGTNPTNFLASSLVSAVEKSKKLSSTLDIIEQKTAKNFLDGPLDYIAAQITLPGDMDNAKMQAASLAATHTSIQQIAQSFNSTAQTYKAQEATVTVASAKAATENAAAQSLLEANRYKMETANQNLNAVQAVMAASDATLRATGVVQSAEATAESQRMQERQWESGASEREFSKLRLESFKADKAAGETSDVTDIKFMNLSLAQAGKPIISPEESKRFLDALNKGDPIARLHWMTGQHISKQAISTSHLGGTPAQAIDYFNAVNPELDTMRRDTVALLQKYEKTVPQGADPKARAIHINKEVQVEINRQYGDIRSGEIFDAGEISQYFGIQELAALPLVSKVLGPASAAKTPMTDPGVVMNLSLKAMKAGIITSTEFSQGVEQLYRKASFVNMTARDLNGAGIRLEDNGKSYKTKLDRWGKPVDLLKPAEVNRWVTEQMFLEDKAKRTTPLRVGDKM